MSARHEPARTRAWAAEGTRLLVEALDAVDDDDFSAPSLLPGWSRAHVVGHVARNAEALTRLATWARTGEETPMYADGQQRDADIEASSRQPPAELRHDVATTAADLDRAFEALPDEAWGAGVRDRHGNDVPARLLPWLRTREVWLHAVDLDVGADLAGAPDGLLEELAADITARLSGRGGCPEVELRPTDRDATWRLGARDGSGAQASTVEGTAADLVVWLAGRSDGASLASAGPLPSLPVWL